MSSKKKKFRRPRPGHIRPSLLQLLLGGLALLALAAIPLGCGDDSTSPTIRHPQDFLPAGTQAMPASGDPSVATDAAGLQDIINGGFQIYMNHGFQEMVQQIYEGTVGGSAATLTVWIFDMANAGNAEALQDELTQEGTWTEVDTIGDEEDRSEGLFAYIILFRQDKYSVRLNISTSIQDAKDLLVLFATHIEQEIGN